MEEKDELKQYVVQVRGNETRPVHVTALNVDAARRAARGMDNVSEIVSVRLDEAWDDRADWFGNDGIDYCTGRLVAAKMPRQAALASVR